MLTQCCRLWAVALVQHHIECPPTSRAGSGSLVYWVPDAIAGGHASHFPGLLGPMLAAMVVTG
jgi:hypothetical protein